MDSIEDDECGVNTEKTEVAFIKRYCKFCQTEFEKKSTYFFVYGRLSCSACWYQEKSRTDSIHPKFIPISKDINLN